MKENKIVRLTINLPIQLHMELKKAAAEEYKTMTRFILEAIFEKMAKKQ
jgi:uncharacterized protein (DUF1778 family)